MNLLFILFIIFVILVINMRKFNENFSQNQKFKTNTDIIVKPIEKFKTNTDIIVKPDMKIDNSVHK